MRAFLIIGLLVIIAPSLAGAQIIGRVPVYKPPPPPPPPPVETGSTDLSGQPVLTTPNLTIIAPAPIVAAPVAATPVQPGLIVPPRACAMPDQSSCANEAANCLTSAWLEDTHGVAWSADQPYIAQYYHVADEDAAAASQCAADLTACLRPRC